MGLFSKFFGGKAAPDFQMAPTSEMMEEDRYWGLVADSLKAADGEQDDQADYLRAALTELSPVDIVGFRLRTDKLLFDTYNSEMWCAGYIMNGGCSDDAFEYFRLWVISRGRDVYETAKLDADSLAALNGDGAVEGFYDFESFWYVANDAFEKKTGKNLYDHIDYEKFKTCESNYPHNIEFTWTEEDAESRRRICPKLFERFEHAA
jgi:hypothetical protein